ncbi:AzlC family ABC transporter permease [Chelativorans intermedius]|uniref:AzlC family ABC transporter permease n=1 Tax=Chelativorans intermedius TaxID=515947 RepID=A0ABV6D3I9_9HYPH|nr:AzlC family ABC transporter permease [Chelativorans intermedius]MCT8996887.1 AzlC family ABC transporter permease [Chelativorans intermedius]
MSAHSYAAQRPGDEFLQGARASFPVVVAAAPFGLLFGTLAMENGFTIFEAVFMSATIYAGASQMVGIDLFGARIAPWMVVLSIFAVNFRHVLYSATIGRHIAHWTPLQRFVGFFFLVDPQFAEAEKRVERGQRIGFAWYMGLGLPIYVCWVAEAWLGALFGRLIPDPHALGLDFLLPIYFLGLVMSFRKRPLWLPVVGVSALASILAYKTVGSPWHVSIGALAGVALGALLPPREAE